MEQIQREKLIGTAILILGFAALFAWLKFTVLLPPLQNSAPMPNQGALGTVPPTNGDYTAEQTPDSNPFQSNDSTNPFVTTSPTPTYANPFN